MMSALCLAVLGLMALVPVSLANAQSEKPLMKAIVVHEYGGPEVLEFEDAPRPEPKENELLVFHS